MNLKKHIMSARARPGMIPLGSSPVALAQGPERGVLTAPTPGGQPGFGVRPSVGTGLAYPCPTDPRHRSSGQPRSPLAAEDVEVGAAEPGAAGTGYVPSACGIAQRGVWAWHGVISPWASLSSYDSAGYAGRTGLPAHTQL